jgi:hypothetical protein
MLDEEWNGLEEQNIRFSQESEEMSTQGVEGVF